MSWHFSQALVAASSGERSSGGEPSAPLSLTPTPAMCWLPGRTTDAFRPSRSGMTCEPLTADRGAELLTWCLAASLAKTSPPPARAPGSAAPALDSGERWHALLVKFDHASCGWKTARCLWEEGLDWSCLTLPRWGSLHDGELWERATPGLHTNDTESGFWPTPNVPNGGRRVPKDATIKGGKTPTAYTRDGKKCQVGLEQAVKWFPTPTVPTATGGLAMCKWGGSGARRMMKATLPAGDVNGALNPTWVEWLMGWPLGWTDCAAPATAKYQEWRQWHGGF